MKLVRNKAFETNSSSCHSVTVVDTGVYEGVTPDEDGVIHLEPMEFGWEREVYTDTMSKLSYVWLDVHENPDKLEQLERVVFEHTGATKLEMRSTGESWSPYGYIDHQSHGVTSELFDSDDKLKAFLFTSESYVETDNDNH